jgi:hypothetical protein
VTGWNAAMWYHLASRITGALAALSLAVGASLALLLRPYLKSCAQTHVAHANNVS